jgi:hypothetical protein
MTWRKAGFGFSAKILAMTVSFRHFLGWLVSVFRSWEDLVLENLTLRRQVLALHAHFNVPRNPNALWVVQQLREASCLQTAAQILAIRPRRKVWSGGGFVGEGHGKRANSHGLSQSVAERCCGALGGKLPTRLAGPRDLLTSGGRELAVTVWDSNQRRGSVLTN